MTVNLKWRLGGHGGIPTEWEITTSPRICCKASWMMHQLLMDDSVLFPNQGGFHPCPKPEEGAVWNGTLLHEAYWIFLPEGTSVKHAGEVAALISRGDVINDLAEARDLLDRIREQCVQRDKAQQAEERER